MFTSKLLLFLVLASCALIATGRSIPRVAVELDESSYGGVRNDGVATLTWKNDRKANEVKNQVRSVMNNLPGSLGKLEFIDLIENVREDNTESLVESEDGILNNLEVVNQEANINDAREGSSGAMTINNEDDSSADGTYDTQVHLYIADTMDSEIAVDDQQGSGLYEDGKQDNYLDEENLEKLYDLIISL